MSFLMKYESDWPLLHKMYHDFSVAFRKSPKHWVWFTSSSSPSPHLLLFSKISSDSISFLKCFLTLGFVPFCLLSLLLLCLLFSEDTLLSLRSQSGVVFVRQPWMSVWFRCFCLCMCISWEYVVISEFMGKLSDNMSVSFLKMWIIDWVMILEVIFISLKTVFVRWMDASLVFVFILGVG